ncbi:hypothetical protein GALMADRAFT_143398 [Galerina marginata CBS 339.88]|uniref:Uncharacterized protein n=1 Tax=Galerina marginata (strain CBS 339.88) TaxID=685588 RepID=A0A067SWK5_GALM3|nr:hypothetical protein GALMADRAFT_143398 [Galerina marginata CBS 339.88]
MLLILTCNHHHPSSPSPQHLKKWFHSTHEHDEHNARCHVASSPSNLRAGVGDPPGAPSNESHRLVLPDLLSTAPCSPIDPSTTHPSRILSAHPFFVANTVLPGDPRPHHRYLPRFEASRSSAARCLRTRAPLLVLLGCEDTESEQQHALMLLLVLVLQPAASFYANSASAVAVQDDDELVGRGGAVYPLDAPVMRADGRATATSTSIELCWYSPSSCIMRRKRWDEPHCLSRFPNLRSTSPSRCHPPIVNSRRPSPLTAFDPLPPRTKSPREGGYAIATTVVAGFGRRRLLPLTHQLRNVAGSS